MPNHRQESMGGGWETEAYGQPSGGATAAVGSGMRSLGGTIRQYVPAAAPVADGLDRAGRFLQDQGLGGIGANLTNLIRRHPMPALLIGLGIGFLLSRATRRG